MEPLRVLLEAETRLWGFWGRNGDENSHFGVNSNPTEPSK